MDEVEQELQLMPMLNVFISIIPLLLLSAAFVQLAVIPAAVTADGSAPAPAAGEAPFDLAVTLAPEAYLVQANGVAVAQVARDDAKAAREQLGAALAQAVAGHPSHQEVRILAAASTRYEEIIDVMDVSRGAGLPNAALDGDPRGGS